MSDPAAAASLRSWNRLIQLAAASGTYSQCLHRYASFLTEGLRLRGDAYTFPSLAKSCAALRLTRLGRAVHARALLAGADSALFVWTALLDMYAKCGLLPDARRLFDGMPHRTVVSWNCMIAAYSRGRRLEEAVAMLNAMRAAGVEPSEGTLVGLLSGCVDSISVRNIGLCVHGFSVRSGLDAEIRVLKSVLSMLARGGQLDAARRLFDCMHKCVVSWSAMASGYLKMGNYAKVFQLFNYMQGAGHKFDSVVLVNLISAAVLFGNLLVAESVHALVIKGGFESQDDLAASLVNAYGKCGDLVVSRKIFDSVHRKNVVLWTSMISGYVDGGHPDMALTMFNRMLETNIEPNEVTVLSVLSACANLGSASLGRKIEEHVMANGLKSDLRVTTGLIDMYCKCGSIEVARKIFDGVTSRDLPIWSAMINGYACNGKGSEALDLFNEMKNEGVQPDAIVYTHLLTACNHSGFLDEGLWCFNNMRVEYGIEPSMEHYMCMVDMLCKAGHLSTALEIFKQMPFQLKNQVLAPMISACSAHCVDSPIELVSEGLLNLDSQDSGHCILMANMLSSLGNWKQAKSYRRLMSKQGLVKEPGWSCIEQSA